MSPHMSEQGKKMKVVFEGVSKAFDQQREALEVLKEVASLTHGRQN